MKIQLTKNLDPLRASALARLDGMAGEQLHPFTASPVAIVRARKLAEAERWTTGGGAGPLLTVEAETSGIAVGSLADLVLAKAAAASAAAAVIEARRQAAQAVIRSAPDPAAIEAALEEFAHGE